MTRSPSVAATAITFGPVAATSTGTLGSARTHSMRLAVGWSPRPSASTEATSSVSPASANGTSSPRR